MRILPLLLPLLVGLLHTPAVADPGRGQLLYENHCVSCHESTVHIRTDQAARSLAALRDQVMRWQAAIALQWTAEDIGDVVEYLNGAWYHYAE